MKKMKDEKMTDKEQEKAYPVRTLHEFLTEINQEWSKFKRGAILSLITSSILLVAFVLVFYRTARTGFEISDVILEVLLVGFVVYSMYLMNVQYRFFRRWENRMTRLYMFEEKLMPEEETEEVPKD